MEYTITKPSLTRLARQAGIKSIADDCYPYIRSLIKRRLTQVLDNALILNRTKTLLASDIYKALETENIYITKSDCLDTTTQSK